MPTLSQSKGLACSGVPAVDSEQIFRLCGQLSLPVTSAYVSGRARGRALACANLAVRFDEGPVHP